MHDLSTLRLVLPSLSDPDLTELEAIALAADKSRTQIDVGRVAVELRAHSLVTAMKAAPPIPHRVRAVAKHRLGLARQFELESLMIAHPSDADAVAAARAAFIAECERVATLIRSGVDEDEAWAKTLPRVIRRKRLPKVEPVAAPQATIGPPPAPDSPDTLQSTPTVTPEAPPSPPGPVAMGRGLTAAQILNEVAAQRAKAGPRLIPACVTDRTIITTTVPVETPPVPRFRYVGLMTHHED